MRLHVPLLMKFVLLTALSASPGQREAFAQAGTIGGTIGKTDKSVSGEDAADQNPGRRTQRSAHNKSQDSEKWSLPQTILLKERSETRGAFSSTLRYLGNNVYQATWNHGFSSRMTVRVSGSSMTFHREDTGGPVGSVGFVTGTYSGKKSGNALSGTFVVSNGTKGVWEASW